MHPPHRSSQRVCLAGQPDWWEILHVNTAAQPGTALALLSWQALADRPCKGGEREEV